MDLVAGKDDVVTAVPVDDAAEEEEVVVLLLGWSDCCSWSSCRVAVAVL